MNYADRLNQLPLGIIGIALSTAHSNIVAGQRGYGVFRM